MRTFGFVYLLIFIFTSTWAADPEIITRRYFIKAISACSLSSIIPKPTSFFSHRYQWRMDSTANVDTLGLESFGSNLKDLLMKEKYIPDENLAEKVRWKIQDKIWNRLEPKAKKFKPTHIKIKIAVAVSDHRYLYFEPEFRLQPRSVSELTSSDLRTVGSIEYVGDPGDHRMITYGLGTIPPKEFTVINPRL